MRSSAGSSPESLESADMRADDLLVETIEGLLSKEVTPERIYAAEGGMDTALWKLLEDNGLTSVGLPESAGGMGGTLHDLAAIVRAAGRHAAPVPIGDTLVAATFLAGREIPPGPLALAVVRTDRSVIRVPWGGAAEHVVAVSDAGVALHAIGSLPISARGDNYAGEPWIEVAPTALRFGAAPSDAAPSHAQGAGAFARSMLLAGALDRVVDLSVHYANEREQFGKQIGKFQTIQHYLAEMAGEAAAANGALDTALDVASSSTEVAQHILVIAAAKAYAGRAVATVTRLAHQIHGAIGYTDEHRLQYSTRRLWAWRDEFGSESEWAAILGRGVAHAGGDALWPTITRWPAPAA
jgi:acyl-CoA dehydrogenase